MSDASGCESDGGGCENDGGGRVVLIDLGGTRWSGRRASLREAGLSVCACSDGRTGLAASVGVRPDLIVVVVAAGGAEAGVIELVEAVRAISDVPMMLVGEGALSDTVVARARALGVDRFLAAEGAGEGLGAYARRLLTERASAAHRQPGGARAPSVTVARARERARESLRLELERQLRACQGNLAEVARRMGKDRSTIRYHLRRFGMLADDASEASTAFPREQAQTRWPGLRRSDGARSRSPADAQSSPISRLKA